MTQAPDEPEVSDVAIASLARLLLGVTGSKTEAKPDRNRKQAD